MKTVKTQVGKCAILLMVCFLCSQPVLAAPSYITDGLTQWQRGDEGSTWQEWTFDDADNPAAPEYGANPGNPMATLYGYDGSVHFGWNASTLGRQGVWTGDPVFVELFIPNFQTDNPVKMIWFEMDYRAVSMLEPALLVDGNYDIHQVYYDSGLQRDDQGYVIDDWRTMVIGWEVYPNPYSETIRFALAGTGGFVDSVSVDTICVPVPVPSAVLLGGIGISCVSLWKRKRIL